MATKHMTPEEAWDHFWENVYRKEILGTRGGMYTKQQRNALRTAQRDRLGKRTRKDGGKNIGLAPDRVRRLLDEFAPGKYVVHEITFTVNED